MFRSISCAALLVCTLAYAAPPKTAALLPRTFAGWTESTGTPAANAPNAAVLQEYGLKQSAGANYVSGTSHVAVRAWRFADATGAYGAYTFLRQPTMQEENIGRGGAAAGDDHLFWTGATVVEANFNHAAANETAALNALSAEIPQPPGPESVPPPLPHYLPTAGLDPGSIHYAIGAAAYAQMGGALPPSVLDFSQDAEAVSANYGPPSARGTLTLIMYPTPQIAGSHLHAIAALAQSSSMTTKRIGPLVAVVSGNVPPQRAQQLLSQIRFSDYVTMDRPEGYVSEGAKMYHLLMGITALVLILIVAALMLGLFLGGGRALVRKVRGKPVSSVSDEEFISLHLGG